MDGFVLRIRLANLEFLQFLLQLNNQTLLIFQFCLKMSQFHVFSLESESEREKWESSITTMNYA